MATLIDDWQKVKSNCGLWAEDGYYNTVLNIHFIFPSYSLLTPSNFNMSSGQEDENDDFPLDFDLTDEDHVQASISMLDPSVLQSLKEEVGDAYDSSSSYEDEDEGEEKQASAASASTSTVPTEEEKLLQDAVEPFVSTEQPSPHRRQVQQQRRRRSSLLKKTLIKTFSAKEEKTVIKVLNHINKVEERQAKRGFKEINFTAGVMNTLVVAYMFGAHPEHFWLIYLLESAYFIPRKYWNMVRAKPNQCYYYFDFCWMMNFSAWIFLVVLVSPISLPEIIRSFIYRGAFGVACGPLLGATGILPFVAFVFHDVNTMTNVIIHALPPMLIYTLRWHDDDIKAAWPSMFNIDHTMQDVEFFPPGKGPFFLPGSGLGSIAGDSVFIYMLWMIPYISWMLLVGLDLPRKNHPDGRIPQYDTVFHSFWRVGACQTFGRIFWKRPVEVSQKQMEQDDYEWRDFLLYMVIHVILVGSSILTLAYACNSSKHVHMLFIGLVILACVHRGSQRYTYYTTKMYSRIIRKEFLNN